MEKNPMLAQPTAEHTLDEQVIELQQAKRVAVGSQKPEPDAWRSPLSFLIFWWYLRRVLCLVRCRACNLVPTRVYGRTRTPEQQPRLEACSNYVFMICWKMNM